MCINRKNIKDISLIEYRNFLILIEEYQLIKLEIRNYKNNNIDLNENKYDLEEIEKKKNEMIPVEKIRKNNMIIEKYENPVYVNDIKNDGENLFIISEKIEKFYNNQISETNYRTYPLELTISEDFN